MKTVTFITNNLGYKPSKETKNASVIQDTDGNFYSYGYHYPLLFNVADHWFINTAGYSNTTSKHIAWAWQAVDYNATAVELSREQASIVSRSWAPDDAKLSALLEATNSMVERAQMACYKKRRKDTQIYKQLENTLSKAYASNIAVNNIIGRV